MFYIYTSGLVMAMLAVAPTVQAFRTQTWTKSCHTKHDASPMFNRVIAVNQYKRIRSGNTPGLEGRDVASILRNRVRQGKLAVAGAASANGEGNRDALYTPADLDAYCAPWGITLHYGGTLNTYRIQAHRPNGEVAGYTTGFYLGKYLHLDKVQIQRKESAYEPGAPNAPLPGTRVLPWAEKTGNLFQLGAVLGCAAVRYGYDRGARRVELLAIRENEKQHSRLVRYYRIAGFRAIREVGEDLGSLGDRLVWGAEGTLMVADVEEFMRRWTQLMLDSNSSKGGAEENATANANVGSLAT